MVPGNARVKLKRAHNGTSALVMSAQTDKAAEAPEIAGGGNSGERAGSCHVYVVLSRP